MSDNKMHVFFDKKVLSMKCPDGLFEMAPSPLLEHQMMFAEGPERIANIKSVLERGPSKDRFIWQQGREANDDEILLFHTPEYLEKLKKWDIAGKWATNTTYLPAGGLTGVRAGAGTTLEALKAILTGQTKKAYALVRPPSHHAAPDVADGYCFLNCTGMAIGQAKKEGINKIAVIDWDVHHGNGTQEGFYDRDDVLTISLHMDHGAWGKTHPQTGKMDEIGHDKGQGFNLNLPLPMGSGDMEYITIIREIVVPRLKEFAPDLLIVANGHDANQYDPNGRQLLSMKGYFEMANLLQSAAAELCDGKMLLIQEGGYNIAYVGYCAYASLLGFMDVEMDLPDPLAYYPENPEAAKKVLANMLGCHPLL